MEGMQDAPMEQVIPNSRSADGFLCIHYSIDQNVEAQQLTYESRPATVKFPWGSAGAFRAHLAEL